MTIFGNFGQFRFPPKMHFFQFQFFIFSGQSMLCSAVNWLSNIPEVADI